MSYLSAFVLFLFFLLAVPQFVPAAGESDISDTRALDTKPQGSDRSQSPLAVKAEPGDGLVKLNWLPLSLPPRTAGEKPLNYVIRYGTEAGKPLATIPVGSSDTHILRGLTNKQPYYIQVLAVDRDRQLTYSSNEQRVVPLSVEEQGSALEKAFGRQTKTLLDKLEHAPFRRELKQFGYEFFKNSSQMLGAMDSLPVGGDYVLGPGDTLQLSIWGSLSVQHDLVVDRNGEIAIPKVGTVKVWGLTFQQAKEAINTAVGRYFKNYDLGLTLGKLRTIQVFVVGDVEAPGSYPIGSLATVINALAAAGGPAKTGSLRSIKVSRAGKQVAVVDLYEVFLNGDRSNDVRLQNGDTIFVPVIGPVVAVAGEVRRPAIYELKGATSLGVMLQLAGGIPANGFTGRIQVERFSQNSARIVLDYLPQNGQHDKVLNDVALQDRDMVKVFPVQEAVRQVVGLKGNVTRPGDYQFRKGMRLSDLIPDIHSLQPESYLDAVEISRLSPPEYQRQLLSVNLRKALSGSEQDNILLQEQDTVRVFSRWEMQEKPKVGINGAVITPGSYDFYPGMSVRDLVTAAGSPLRNAYLDQAELSRVIIHGDRATSTRVSLDLGKALAGDLQHNFPLQADDVLIVRSLSNWNEATDTFVKVKGEVLYPGVYSYQRGERLSSLIERAGGYTDRAYLRGAKFIRRSVREDQQKRMDEVIVKTEKELMQKQTSLASLASSKDELEATKATLEGLMRGLEQMKKMRAEGRVVIRIARLEQLRQSDYNIELEAGDELEVPSRPGTLNVLGQVFNATSFVYLPDTPDVGDYLAKAGGPTREAEASDMYVIRSDGSVFSRQQSSFGIHYSQDGKRWSFGSFMSSPLEPGDTLVVPQKIERIVWMREIKDITQILSNVALAAGSVYLWFK